jgi:glycosyltransferase involved in cell wall biosynthesis
MTDEPSMSPTLAICICAMDRVDVLQRCLQSIASGSLQPDAIFVSDDSADGSEMAEACRKFSSVTYLKGPRRGLCANRNHVIAQAATTHVCLIDDDGVFSENFVAVSKKLISGISDNIIITGFVREGPDNFKPSNPSFLGHFRKPPRDKLENINLNCNLFPRHAFDVATFDEAIGFGYEDMDLCAHLLFAGFHIQFEPALQTMHMPPERTRSGLKTRFLRTERARFYTSVKRYMLWNRNYFALFAYLAIAPAHRALFAIKSGLWFDLKHCIPDMMAAIRGALREKARLQKRAIKSPETRSPSCR